METTLFCGFKPPRVLLLLGSTCNGISFNFAPMNGHKPRSSTQYFYPSISTVIRVRVRGITMATHWYEVHWPQLGHGLRLAVPLPVCTSPWLPARMLKVYPVGRGRADSWQVCPGPHTSPASLSPASLTQHCQGPVVLMYCLLIPGEGRGKGRGQVILVQPAVSRWPTTVADRGH